MTGVPEIARMLDYGVNRLGARHNHPDPLQKLGVPEKARNTSIRLCLHNPWNRPIPWLFIPKRGLGRGI